MPQAWHLLTHTGALACAVLGVVAAFKSHTLKRPTPMSDLYSSLQYFAGVAAYLFPRLPMAQRRALGPLHAYAGKAVFVAGLATMAVSCSGAPGWLCAQSG